jgi:polyamine oxidase
MMSVVFHFCLLLLVLVTVTTSTNAEDAQAPGYDYDVIIMGAGMTGISAGLILHRDRYNILLIEAQDYVGGRTHVLPLAGHHFNVGASWIEGWCDTFETDPEACAYNGQTPTAVNPMQTLAGKYKLKYVEVGYRDTSTMTMLQPLEANSTEAVNFADKAEVDAAWSKWNATQACMLKMWRVMEHEDYEFQDFNYITGLYQCGWAAPLTSIEKAVQFVGYSSISNTFHYMSFMNNFPGKGVFGAFGKQTQFIIDERGYPGITLGIAGEYLNLNNISGEPKLIINSPITKISYTREDKIAVTIEPTDGTPMRTITAKYAINTFSLGVFQSNIVEYDPPLPNWKRDAFLAQTITDYLPVLVQFPYDFWTKLGITSQVVEFADPRQGYWVWAYNLDHPSFYPGSLVWRFDLIVGDAVRVAFQSNNDTIWEFVHEKMSHFFGPGVMPTPVDMASAKWSANKYVHGSFSMWNMGMNSEKWGKMLEPFITEGLFFGGEAVAVYSGDVNGAYDNGIFVAREVIACDRGEEFEGVRCPDQKYHKR